MNFTPDQLSALQRLANVKDVKVRRRGDVIEAAYSARRAVEFSTDGSGGIEVFGRLDPNVGFAESRIYVAAGVVHAPTEIGPAFNEARRLVASARTGLQPNGFVSQWTNGISTYLYAPYHLHVPGDVLARFLTLRRLVNREHHQLREHNEHRSIQHPITLLRLRRRWQAGRRQRRSRQEA